MENKIKKILDLKEEYDLCFCIGLAPNPKKITFKGSCMDACEYKQLHKLINELNEDEEKELKQRLFGRI